MAGKTDAMVWYLVEERDAVLEEKKRIRAAVQRIVEDEIDSGPASRRANLLANPAGRSFGHQPLQPPSSVATNIAEAEQVERKSRKVNEHFEVVDRIERIRQATNSAGNTDKQFLQSLNSVLGELRRDYFREGEVGMERRDSRTRAAQQEDEDVKDSLTELQASQVSEMDRTRSSG